MARKQQRIFGMGEKVRISKKSRVVDKDRSMEADKTPIDQDVTGLEGSITGDSYSSPIKDGEYCVPIKLANGAVVGVPEERLESAARPIRGGYSGRYASGWDRAFGRKKKARSTRKGKP